MIRKSQNDRNTNVVIENWSMVAKDISPYMAPEQYVYMLHGEIYGHPKFEDGEIVLTSAITGIDGECLLTANGGRYILGTADPRYEARFPNARERMYKAARALKEAEKRCLN